VSEISSQNISDYITLTPNEHAFFKSVSKKQMRFCLTEYYLKLLQKTGSAALRKQCIPSKQELKRADYELDDPLGEKKYSPLPRLVHRYKNRIVVKVTDQCAMYCRHCFRNVYTSGMEGAIQQEELNEITGYLYNHNEVTQVLITGGDPLVLSDVHIKKILHGIRKARPDIVIRIGTRIPVVNPGKIDTHFAGLISKYNPVWISTQFNHPYELTESAKNAVGILIDHGIPVMNQAVLLKGVNNSVKVLADLFSMLIKNRIKPYYLFQLDLAPGISHFRVPIENGLQLYQELSSQLGGLELPVYALDLPGGGGKIRLDKSRIISKDSNSVYLLSYEDSIFPYPRY